MNLENIEVLDHDGIILFNGLDIDEARILWAKWIDSGIELTDTELKDLNMYYYDFVEEYVRNYKLG